MDPTIELQNRNRNKKKHRQKGNKKEKDNDVPQELIDEAAKLGCEVWEVEEVKAKLEEEGKMKE